MDIFDFLLEHPVILLGAGVLVIAFIVSVVKKIIKFALIVFIVLILAGGAIYRAATEAVKEGGGKIQETVRDRSE